MRFRKTHPVPDLNWTEITCDDPSSICLWNCDGSVEAAVVYPDCGKLKFEWQAMGYNCQGWQSGWGPGHVVLDSLSYWAVRCIMNKATFCCWFLAIVAPTATLADQQTMHPDTDTGTFVAIRARLGAGETIRQFRLRVALRLSVYSWLLTLEQIVCHNQAIF